jgi:hypothetical protein
MNLKYFPEFFMKVKVVRYFGLVSDILEEHLASLGPKSRGITPAYGSFMGVIWKKSCKINDLRLDFKVSSYNPRV